MSCSVSIKPQDGESRTKEQRHACSTGSLPAGAAVSPQQLHHQQSDSFALFIWINQPRVDFPVDQVSPRALVPRTKGCARPSAREAAAGPLRPFGTREWRGAVNTADARARGDAWPQHQQRSGAEQLSGSQPPGPGPGPRRADPARRPPAPARARSVRPSKCHDARNAELLGELRWVGRSLLDRRRVLDSGTLWQTAVPTLSRGEFGPAAARAGGWGHLRWFWIRTEATETFKVPNKRDDALVRRRVNVREVRSSADCWTRGDSRNFLLIWTHLRPKNWREETESPPNKSTSCLFYLLNTRTIVLQHLHVNSETKSSFLVKLITSRV